MHIHEKIIRDRFNVWKRLLKDIDKTAEEGKTVVRFPNSSTYIFSTGKTRWIIDPSYSENVPDSELDCIAESLKDFAFCIVSHLHPDHCQFSLIRRMAPYPIRWVIPRCIESYFVNNSGVSSDKIIVLDKNESAVIENIEINMFGGYHDEPGRPDVPAGSFAVRLPSGKRLFFPVDVRDYRKSPPENISSPDYVFAHLWLGRGVCMNSEFPMLDDYCRFFISMNPRNIVVTHLYELSRGFEWAWTYRHADMAVKRLREMNQEVNISIPRPGDMLVLENEDNHDHYREWTAENKAEFRKYLGTALKRDISEQLDEAISLKIPVIELPAHIMNLEQHELSRKIAEWHRVGGCVLSFHMVDIYSDPARLSDARRCADYAAGIGFDRITVHAPQYSVAYMKAHMKEVLENYRYALEPFILKNIVIGIENQHLKKNITSDERGYGYIPEECLAFADELSAFAGYPKIGVHLDIGHAYSNWPLSDVYPVCRWFEMCGARINGVHIHQFDAASSPERPYTLGHHHIVGRVGGSPSMTDLYSAWERGLFKAPIFIETNRGDEYKPFPSYLRLIEE